MLADHIFLSRRTLTHESDLDIVLNEPYLPTVDM